MSLGFVSIDGFVSIEGKSYSLNGGLVRLEGKDYGPVHLARRADFEERINSFASSFARWTAGRVDALVLKIPALLFVGALQSAKILLKAAVCVLTFNRCKHINKFWSFSGVENEVVLLAVMSVNLVFTVTDVILAPNDRYSPSGVILFKGLLHVFGGKHHLDYERYIGYSKIKDHVDDAIGLFMKRK